MRRTPEQPEPTVMRALIAFSACLSVSCAVTPPVTSEQEERAFSAVRSCLALQAVELDDRMSDASTIGRSVAAACRRDADVAMSIGLQGFNSRAYIDGYTAEFMAAYREHATMAVLAARSKRRP